jgi:hypothetical protein
MPLGVKTSYGGKKRKGKDLPYLDNENVLKKVKRGRR